MKKMRRPPHFVFTCNAEVSVTHSNAASTLNFCNANAKNAGGRGTFLLILFFFAVEKEKYIKKIKSN